MGAGAGRSSNRPGEAVRHSVESAPPGKPFNGVQKGILVVSSHIAGSGERVYGTLDGLPGGGSIPQPTIKFDYVRVGLHCPQCGLMCEHLRPEDCIRDLLATIGQMKIRPGTFSNCIKALRECLALME